LRPGLASALHNPGPPSRQSPPGVGTWQCSRSAQTAVCAAKPQPISAGHLPSGQSRGGSPTNSLSTRVASRGENQVPWPTSALALRDAQQRVEFKSALEANRRWADVPPRFDPDALTIVGPHSHRVEMNSLAIPTAHGHIARTVWATPRIAALAREPQARGKAQEAEGRALARSGGCVVLNPGIHAALHICA
jgi:hypothetical protein